jgi:hypothetical protein
MKALDPLLRAAVAEVDPCLAHALEELVDEYAARMLALMTAGQPGLVDLIVADRAQRLVALHLTCVEPWGSA